MPTITMVGAGSVVFARTLMTDILSLPETSDARIKLTDIDTRRLATAKTMIERVAQAVGSPARVEATLDRREAIRGADYVINAVQVGMHEATLADFDIPRRYGLKQTIADTLGIGGIFRALRTIPVLLDICRDMEEVAPDAWLLNYTNPMAMLCLAIRQGSGIRRAVGLCHSVQGTSRQIASYIGVPYDEVSYRVAGINHMAWFLDYRHNGVDAYPRLWQAMNDPATFARDKVRFEMMRRLGYFITESSEHLSEYVPYFLKRDDLIERFNIPIDEYVRRSEHNLTRFEETAAALERGEPLAVRPSHEYAAYIIRALVTGQDWSFHGNVANDDLITNLPRDACVEVACLVNRAGIQPCHVGDLPPQLAAMNRTNINVQQLTVAAALTGNRDHVYHAAMLDPHAAATLSLDEIWAMTDELIEAHGSLLPRLTSHRLQPVAAAIPTV